MTARRWSFTPLPADSPLTEAEIEALIAEATTEEYVIWPGADFMPATGRSFPGLPDLNTGIWEGYNLTGLEWQPGVEQTGCRTLFFPVGWASLTLNAVILAGEFGSGTTRWYRSGDDSTAVDIALGPSYVGQMFADVPGAVATPMGKKMLQMPVTRQGDVDVFGQGASVLAFYGTEGA